MSQDVFERVEEIATWAEETAVKSTEPETDDDLIPMGRGALHRSEGRSEK